MGFLFWFLLGSLAIVRASKHYDRETCGLPQAEYLEKYEDNKIDSPESIESDSEDNESDNEGHDYHNGHFGHDEDDENDSMRRKVMGGVRAEKGELPWVVAIRGLGIKRNCGGTLVTKRHVVTAAHCFMDHFSDCKKFAHGTVTKYGKILVGGTCTEVNLSVNCTREDVGVEFRIKRVYYNDFSCKFTNDIAILELSKDVPDSINHICLPFMHDKVEELEDPSLQLSSFGWGEDPVNNYFHTTSFLQRVELGAAMPEQQCKKHRRVKDTFCTYEQPDVNVCHGDSGGGIVASVEGRSYLMGVVSYGTSCSRLYSGIAAPAAQVNTNVTYFARLIKEQTGLGE